jgi:hypothetical protein
VRKASSTNATKSPLTVMAMLTTPNTARRGRRAATRRASRSGTGSRAELATSQPVRRGGRAESASARMVLVRAALPPFVDDADRRSMSTAGERWRRRALHLGAAERFVLAMPTRVNLGWPPAARWTVPDTAAAAERRFGRDALRRLPGSFGPASAEQLLRSRWRPFGRPRWGTMGRRPSGVLSGEHDVCSLPSGTDPQTTPARRSRPGRSSDQAACGHGIRPSAR